MEALNLGDVRKFENGVIGVVLEESGPYYAVLMIDGSLPCLMIGWTG